MADCPDGNVWLSPVGCCWPMGFSWSSAVAQNFNVKVVVVVVVETEPGRKGSAGPKVCKRKKAAKRLKTPDTEKQVIKREQATLYKRPAAKQMVK